jgi:hypothetical protein
MKLFIWKQLFKLNFVFVLLKGHCLTSFTWAKNAVQYRAFPVDSRLNVYKTSDA